MLCCCLFFKVRNHISKVQELLDVGKAGRSKCMKIIINMLIHVFQTITHVASRSN